MSAASPSVVRWLLLFVLMLPKPAAAFDSVRLPRNRGTDLHKQITLEAANLVGLPKCVMTTLADVDVDWHEYDFDKSELEPKPNEHYTPRHHFDRGPSETHRDAFFQGVSYFRFKVALVRQQINRNQHEQAMNTLGNALHALQDFFSHSNYADGPPGGLTDSEKALVIDVLFGNSSEFPPNLKIAYYDPALPEAHDVSDPIQPGYTHEDRSKDYQSKAHHDDARNAAGAYTALFIADILEDTGSAWCKEKDGRRVVQGSSEDPNDKVGPMGVASQRHIHGDTPLGYAIAFENKESATLPAQEMSVTDQLDLAHLNPATFSLGPIRFGDRLVVPRPHLKTFSATVDQRPQQNLLVSVSANLDSTGILTWKLAALDPLTNLPPEDPSAGFLPPGGQGSVFFTIMPNVGLATGTPIDNQASIVFDVNTPILTQTWTNTVDNSAPASAVLSLPATTNARSFLVQWVGTDTGSGIQVFTVYVSEDGGPFSVFQGKTTATSAMFTGQPGHVYGFYVIAQDAVGNVESEKVVADTTTQVTLDTEPPHTTATMSSPPNAKGWHNSSVSVALSAVDNDGGSGVKHITYRLAGGPSVPVVIVQGDTVFVPISTEGTTVVSFFAEDHAGKVETEQSLTVRRDVTPPDMTVADLTLEATGPDGAVAVFTVPTTDNLDTGVTPVCSVASGTVVPMGVTRVTCQAEDHADNQTLAAFTIDVKDTTAPSILSLSSSLGVLWPPNHILVPVHVTVIAADSVDPTPACRIVSVDSNEPEDGQGDGDTAPDWIIDGALVVRLRAERAGGGAGRVYASTVECRDTAGNVSRKSVLVTVPHDRR